MPYYNQTTRTMKTRDSNLGYALLGQLHQDPSSGYDLRKIFTATPLAHFSDSPGAIYPALNRLRRRGWIEPVPGEAPSGRRRQVLRPTAAGRRAFRNWLLGAVTREDVVRGLDGLVLRLAFMSGAVRPVEIAAFLRSLRDAVRAYLRELEQFLRAEQSRMSLTGRLAFESGLEGLRAQIRWAEHALRRLRGLGSSKGSRP